MSTTIIINNKENDNAFTIIIKLLLLYMYLYTSVRYVTFVGVMDAFPKYFIFALIFIFTFLQRQSTTI